MATAALRPPLPWRSSLKRGRSLHVEPFKEKMELMGLVAQDQRPTKGCSSVQPLRSTCGARARTPTQRLPLPLSPIEPTRALLTRCLLVQRARRLAPLVPPATLCPLPCTAIFEECRLSPPGLRVSCPQSPPPLLGICASLVGIARANCLLTSMTRCVRRTKRLNEKHEHRVRSCAMLGCCLRAGFDECHALCCCVNVLCVCLRAGLDERHAQCCC